MGSAVLEKRVLPRRLLLTLVGKFYIAAFTIAFRYCYLNMQFGVDGSTFINAQARAQLNRLICRVNQYGDIVVLLGNQDLESGLCIRGGRGGGL